jgi:hypothetical protein
MLRVGVRSPGPCHTRGVIGFGCGGGPKSQEQKTCTLIECEWRQRPVHRNRRRHPRSIRGEARRLVPCTPGFHASARGCDGVDAAESSFARLSVFDLSVTPLDRSVTPSPSPSSPLPLAPTSIGELVAKVPRELVCFGRVLKASAR